VREGGFLFGRERVVPEDAGGNVAASADGDDEMGTEGVQDVGRSFLAHLVHLYSKEKKKG
jgi:hypothetical protein